MLIYAAIDLYEGQAVRLYKGDYAKKTVYNENPLAVAQDFQKKGITHIHLVDLEGALKGTTPKLISYESPVMDFHVPGFKVKCPYALGVD